MSNKILALSAAAVLALASGPVVSQAQEADGQSNEELAKALADPNTTLGTLNFNVDYVSYKGNLPGASSQDAWRVSFQPVLPYALNETTNLFVRPNIPVFIGQPVPVVNGADVSPTAGRFFTQDGDFRNTGTNLVISVSTSRLAKRCPARLFWSAGLSARWTPPQMRQSVWDRPCLDLKLP